MKARPRRLIADPDDPRHGKVAGNRAHIFADVPMCDPCRLAINRYNNQLLMQHDKGSTRRVEARGPQRRVRALVAIGWSFAELGREFGMSAQAVQQFAHDNKDFCLASKADRVNAEFERLSMTLPPQRNAREKQGMARALAVARRHGWVPPLAWDDIDNDEAPIQAEDDMSAKERRDADRLDFLELADAAGRNVTYAAEGLGITREGLNAWCRERGHMDLYWRLVKRDPEAGDNQHLAA